MGALGVARGVALALALVGCATVPPPSLPSPLLGRPVPDFQRRAIDGRRIDTAALRGRPLVLEFFARYCAPCVRALPRVVALSQQRPEIAFIGVSEDEWPSEAARLAGEHGVAFEVVHDAGQVLLGRFRGAGLPLTVVVDPAGIVRWVGSDSDALAGVLDSIR